MEGQNPDQLYDVFVAGGGLAGLGLSVQLAKMGYKTMLAEKEQYPFHKVCGEYISMESWDFLQNLGLDLKALHLPLITQLQVSAVNGKTVNHSLPLGGFGISRYYLDHALRQLAETAGGNVEENCKVSDIVFDNGAFRVETSKGVYKAKIVCGCYGKRSNIDVKWKRPFVTAVKNRLNNYVGVKYHILYDFPVNTIALHNFQDGYCGISKIEDDKYCLCYLTTAENIRKSNGSVAEMEKTILSQNPHLKKIFSEAEILYEAPVTISQISFDKKSQIENHVLMIGDAAGMITPLCGNGMSMALHASKLAARQIDLFLKGSISREEMEQQYTKLWQREFSGRLRTGRRIQRLFGKNWQTNLFISVIKNFPAAVRFLIKQTHGKPF